MYAHSKLQVTLCENLLNQLFGRQIPSTTADILGGEK